ncbi:hypothetical protein PC9H_003622 [Pleurotus ostreatus]|uniref:GST N-terminal domain-containing protein n=2 Tax=Pleurotus TaxID=5320 RepID=A0A8H7DU32_PLEOS|nr:uncharacterized protein PC9H_003622 [Pleurotus ostreatus]KAF7436789.1 hypothetical protein PC9H_003622 [Pleurotus ostreatus]KAG9222783.1 hypothetical protein CCMSSC00406_0000528 [Pleurotus cornucopiae]
MSTQVPKAVLYYSTEDPWSAVALLALEEKGYGRDELDLRVVDIGKGEHFKPTFLRLNPKATVPTLIVPLQKTLSEDVESRYKAITDSVAIADFLDKSRSALSRTHTTSALPAPVLTPATIAFASTSRIIINDILHGDDADPTALKYLDATDDASLLALSKEVLPLLTGQHLTLSQLLSDSEGGDVHVSEKVKGLWRQRKSEVDAYLEIFSHADKPGSGLDLELKQKRDEYFARAKLAWELKLKESMSMLSKEMIGPYVLGDQLSVADLHLMAWLARMIKLAGGSFSDDGNTAIAKLENRVGNGFKLPQDYHLSELQRQEGASAATQSKLAAFWDAVGERASWKKVYGNGLY